MTLARDLIDATLAADLTQNELRVFLALFRQTICYGKIPDPLTVNRIAHISQIRKDRLPPALNKILQIGLFTEIKSKSYEHYYAIHADFLAKHPQGFYAPSIPQKRSSPCETDPSSEKRAHTSTTLTVINPTTTPASEKENAETLPYPTHFTHETRQAAARILDGLSPTDARDCLLILNQNLKTQRIQSPLGYLHHLAQAARQGSLDRSQLSPYRTTEPTPDMAKKLRLRHLQAEINTLDALFKQAGVEMDKRSAAQRAAYMAEYQQLKSSCPLKE